MSHEIFLEYFIEYLFFCSSHGFNIELYDILYSIFLQIVHIANWCTWLAHTLCKVLIWYYKNCWAQPWLPFGILQALRWNWECIRVFGVFWGFFYWCRILFWNLEICNISLFSFGWWYTLMKNKHKISLYLGLKKMANVFLFVCACHAFFTMFPSWYHHEIFNDRSDVYPKVQGQRSKVKVTEVKTQISRFGTITPVWFHIWWWNDTQSLILFMSGALLIFKVIGQISGSHGYKIVDFDPNWAFSDCISSFNSQMAMKWCIKIEVA